VSSLRNHKFATEKNKFSERHKRACCVATSTHRLLKLLSQCYDC
jgi:hypothetical protein